MISFCFDEKNRVIRKSDIYVVLSLTIIMENEQFWDLKIIHSGI